MIRLRQVVEYWRHMNFGLVHHIEYYVNDLESSKKFWSWFLTELGYSLYQDFDEGFSFRHSTGTYIVFVQVEEQFRNTKNTRQGNGLNHIAFMGGTIQELDKMQSEFELRKIKILKRKHEYLCFEEPNGFAVEVYAKA